MKYASIVHRVVGVLAVVAFLGTGLYMHWTLPPPSIGTHLMRMLYRSAHVYLLLSGLINIALGSYFVPSRSAGVRRVQGLGSALILIAPVLILAAFCYEVATLRLDRPIVVAAMVSLLAGSLFHLLASSSSSART
jgi:heme A synthase